MKFIITVQQMQNQEVFGAVMQMVSMSATSRPLVGAVEYWISRGNEPLAEQYIPLAIREGIDIQEYNLWIKVPNSTLDNKVPDTWPDAMIGPEGEEVTKRFDQYTKVIEGKNDEGLILIGHWPTVPFGVRAVPSPEETSRFIDYLAGGDLTKVIYGSLKSQWESDNVDVAVE